jgi:protein-S-isoprenylcysteine O-methyltransferase Ste14
LGLIGTVIMADSWLTVPLAFSASCVYVLMALTEEQWLEDRYGATYLEYKNRTARFFDLQGFLQYLVGKTQPSRRTG